MSSILTEADDIIEGKSDTHGPPEDSFGRIAGYWNTYLRIEHDPDMMLDMADVAEMLALFKLARAQSGRYNEDDYRDRVGYCKFASDFRKDND